MNRFNFYKEIYLEEIRRKEQLRTALTLPTGILTVIGGVIAVYLGEFIKGGESFANWTLGITLVILIIFFILAIYYLARSYHGYEYIYIPCATDLEYTYKNLVIYYQDDMNSAERAKTEYKKQLTNRMAHAQEKNAHSNDSKSEYLHNAIRYMFYCLIMTSICAIPFYFQI